MAVHVTTQQSPRGEPVKKFENAHQISVKDGHLYVQAQRVVAIFAPGTWSDAEVVTDAK